MKNGKSLAKRAIEALSDLLEHTKSGQILNEDAVRRAHLELEILRKDLIKLRYPHIVIEVSGGVAEVNEKASKGDYTYEIRDYDNCPRCGGVLCHGGHEKPCPSEKKV